MHSDGIVPSQCSVDRAITRLTAHLKWETAHDPLHADTKKTCGVGSGMAFANAIKCWAGLVGLVPCAVGGTAIKEWGRGAYLYENMIKPAKAAVQGGGGRIMGVVWYQGESDCTKHCVGSYKGHMEELISNIRCDLDLPHLPIIQVAIASGDEPYIEKIREVQKKMDLPNVVCVDAKGLELKEDNLHLTTEAQVQLGLMLADAYLTHFAPTHDS